jgi:streptogramin lyase
MRWAWGRAGRSIRQGRLRARTPALREGTPTPGRRARYADGVSRRRARERLTPLPAPWLLALAAIAGPLGCGSKVDVQRTPAPPLDYVFDAAWTALPGGRALGEVAGLALDASGALYVFHRAGAGFDNTEVIEAATIAVIDPESGAVVRELGAGLFVTPHGIAIDAQDHLWLTDTGQDRVYELDRMGEVLHVYDGL